MKINTLCYRETESGTLMPYLGQWSCIYLTVYLVHSKAIISLAKSIIFAYLVTLLAQNTLKRFIEMFIQRIDKFDKRYH